MPTTPAPIVVEPSGEFLGNDGSWSMFEIGVGVPPQKVQVLPSTQVSQALVVIPSGCNVLSGDPSNCTEARGGAYDSTKSSDWTSKNIFPLNIEVNLGLIHNSDNGAYGYDDLGIPTSSGENITMTQQLISGVATKDFFLGSLGLSSLPISFKDPPDQRPSLITSLKDANLIPSLSYGYTAGAFYRNQTGSLTLGGYDASKFVPNDISIEFADSPTRQLVVALKSITYSDSDSNDQALLTDGILTLIDTTVPHIWLPLAACQSFENAFGISYEPISNLYLVNSTIHDDLLKQNASVTFELGASLGSSPSAKITFPYASFDLDVGYPLVPKNKPSKYFPLRRAADDTQYTLGRAFVQESYLIVDYGSRNFSISQATVSNAPAQVVAISASNVTASTTTPSGTPASGPAVVKTVNHHSGFPVGAIAGIVVVVVLILLGIGGWFFRKHLQKRKKQQPDSAELGADAPYPKHHKEVDATHAEESYDRKEAVETNAYSVMGMESPRLEMGDDRVTFEGYYSKGHGTPMELPATGPIPEPINRSELSSPEPVSRQASPTPYELSTADPPCAEMASPLNSPMATPPLEPPSALSSPRYSRPGLGSRRTGNDRLSSSTSDASGFNILHIQRMSSPRSNNSGFSKDATPLRPERIRKESDDSGFTQETTTGRPPISMRNDSTESGFTLDTLPARRPSQGRLNSDDSNVSDALMSPKQLPYHPHHLGSHDPEPMATPLEEEIDQDSDSPLVGSTEPQIAQLGQRRSANLISQKSSSSSPSKSSIPRNEVASLPPSRGHRRQELMGGPPSALSSPYLGSSGFTGTVRSSSIGSRFGEDFGKEVT